MQLIGLVRAHAVIYDIDILNVNGTSKMSKLSRRQEYAKSQDRLDDNTTTHDGLPCDCIQRSSVDGFAILILSKSKHDSQSTDTLHRYVTSRSNKGEEEKNSQVLTFFVLFGCQSQTKHGRNNGLRGFTTRAVQYQVVPEKNG